MKDCMAMSLNSTLQTEKELQTPHSKLNQLVATLKIIEKLYKKMIML